jgi:phosphopantothenoylcysteine decarboxylase/phosphopantothenate--cysteine ligase
MALIALGVTGGIGAYKAVEVCRGLQKRGHDVQAVMTRSARRFVTPLTFEAITRRPVITSQWRPGMNADIEHIAVADHAALLLVAPCTANVIGTFANGIADDFLTSLYLATQAPVLLAPAMNSNMLAHAAVRQNLETLQRRGVQFVEPGEGYLACGWVGKGRLAEPDDIVEVAVRVLAGAAAPPAPGLASPVAASGQDDSALRGRKVLVTAGPTYEDIDPVRYVGNRSSGRMGYALAAEAARRGAEVTLVTGPTHLAPPSGIRVIPVETAEEMRDAVLHALGPATIVIKAAAVADYRPAAPAAEKIRSKQPGLTLPLAPTADILREVARAGGNRFVVGFAAETGEATERGRAKLEAKDVDLMVANDVSRPDIGFDVEENEVVMLDRWGGVVPLARRPKAAVADAILDRVQALRRAAAGARTAP